MASAIASSVAGLPYMVPRPSTPPLEDRPATVAVPSPSSAVAAAAAAAASRAHNPRRSTGGGRGGGAPKGLLKRPRKDWSKKSRRPRLRFKQNEVRIFEPKSPAAHNRGTFFEPGEGQQPAPGLMDGDSGGVNFAVPARQVAMVIPPRAGLGDGDEDIDDERIPIPPRRPRRKSWETLPPRDISSSSDENDDDIDDDDDMSAFIVPPRFSSSPINTPEEDTNREEEESIRAQQQKEQHQDATAWFDEKMAMLKEAQNIFELEMKSKEESFEKYSESKSAALDLARAELAEDRQKLDEESAKFKAGAKAFASEKLAFEADKHAFDAEREAFEAERDAFQALSAERGGFEAELQAFKTEKAAFKVDKKNFLSKSRAYKTKEEVFRRRVARFEEERQQAEALSGERGDIEAEREKFDAERLAFSEERAVFVAEKEALALDKKTLSSKSRSFKTKEEIFRRRVARFEDEKKQAEELSMSIDELEAEVELLEERKAKIEQYSLETLARTMQALDPLTDAPNSHESLGGGEQYHLGEDGEEEEENIDADDDRGLSTIKSFSSNRLRSVPSIPQVRQQPEQQRQFMSDGTPIPPPPSKGRPPLRKRKGPARVVQYDDHYDHVEDEDDSEILEDSGDDEWQNSGSESGRDGSGRYDMRGVPPPPHREVPQYSTETPRQWFNGEPANSPVPSLPSREPQVWYGAGVEDDALPLPPRRPSREDLPPRPHRTENGGNDESSDWSPASVKSLARTLSQSGIQIFAEGMH